MARGRAAPQAPPTRDGSRGRLCPNPIELGHPSSRDPRPHGAGESPCFGGAPGEPHDICVVRPRLTRSRGLPGRAASHTSSRKEDALGCTRGAFDSSNPLSRVAVLHRLFPICGRTANAFSISACSGRTDVRREAMTRPWPAAPDPRVGSRRARGPPSCKGGRPRPQRLDGLLRIERSAAR